MLGFFSPSYLSGEPVRLPLQFFAYKFNSVWPLVDQSSWWHRLAKNFTLTVSLLCYLGTLLAEFSFIAENPGDIPAMAECLTTTLMGMQYIVRISLLSAHQPGMRALLRRFYCDICFTASEDSSLRRQVDRITSFVDFFTKIYYIPMCIIVLTFIGDVLSQEFSSTDKPYFYRMSFRWYDAQQPLPYIATSLYTGWLTLSCVTLMAADDYMLSIMLCHTSYRYKGLQAELQRLLYDALRDVKQGGVPPTMTAPMMDTTTTTAATMMASPGFGGPFNLHNAFRRRLYRVFRRQQRLHSFIDDAKSHFTYQIFCFVSFGVASLCMVMFQFQRTTIGIGWVKYVVWVISQLSQFILIGHFGQMLMDEAAEMQHSFYMCNWEALLPHSTPAENNKLMADIKFAIANGQRPIVFDGMKMFPLSHNTVGTALRSAMSYFMFLNTMNDANKS